MHNIFKYPGGQLKGDAMFAGVALSLDRAPFKIILPMPHLLVCFVETHQRNYNFGSVVTIKRTADNCN